MNDLFSRMGTLGEMFKFFWKRKLYWLIPMIVVLVVFSLLIILGNSGGIAPFIYTIF